MFSKSSLVRTQIAFRMLGEQFALPIETETATETFARAEKLPDDDSHNDPLLHKPLKCRSVFISDLHLGTKTCRAGDIVRALNHLDPEYLFLLGDIIDEEEMGGIDLLKMVRQNRAQGTVVMKGIRAFRRDVKIAFIPGNHDAVLRNNLSNDPIDNLIIKNNVIHETAKGERLLLLHGDQFDATIREYGWLAYIGTNVIEYAARFGELIDWMRTSSWINPVFNLARLPEHWSLSHALRSPSDATTYNRPFEKTMLAYASRYNRKLAAIGQRPFDAIMCGHTHTPSTKYLTLPYNKRPLTYHNTGAWVGRPNGAEHSIGGLTEAEIDRKWRENLGRPVCTLFIEMLDGEIKPAMWNPDTGIVFLTERDANGDYINPLRHPGSMIAAAEPLPKRPDKKKKAGTETAPAPFPLD